MSGPFLRRIDKFRQYQEDDTSKTYFGGILTIFLPLIVLAYGALIAFLTYQEPDLVEQSALDFTNSTAFLVSFRCAAPNGCYYSNNYEGVSSVTCKAASKLILGNGGGTSSYQPVCYRLEYQQIATIPVCFTSDPIDGPAFIWERGQDCQFGTPADSQNYPKGYCPFGVELLTRHYQRSSQKFAENWMKLFYGIQVLSLANVTSPVSTFASTVSPIFTSDSSVISKINLCCEQISANNSCYSSGTPGTVNDHVTTVSSGLLYKPGSHYQVKLRTFPNFEKITFSRPNIYTTTLTALGSGWSIVTLLFSLLVAIYRKCACKAKRGTKASSQAPTTNDLSQFIRGTSEV